MEIKRFVSNLLSENVYLLSYDKDCIMIDPGGDVEEVLEYIEKNTLKLQAILITHGHYDHIASLNKILKKYSIPIYIGKEDKEKLFDFNLSLSAFIDGKEYSLDKSAKIIEVTEGMKLFNFVVLHTPGHTSGSVCYYAEEENCIFTGDTLFKMAIGRVDFPTGDSRQMRDSLNRLFKLNENIVVYPGHGESTTIGEEYLNYYGTYY